MAKTGARNGGMAVGEEVARHPERARYRSGQRAGHYESFFLRANHPQRPLAFWIRYTIFSPEGRPEAALGELWGIFFDGEGGEHVAVKQEVPISRCRFDSQELNVCVAESYLAAGRAQGGAATGPRSLSWDLWFEGTSEPLFLLPERLYATRLPRAKSLVILPLAEFRGSLAAGGKTIALDRWIGSLNHNWGSRHTDHYAWGQVAGFDGHPDSFLEVATARLRVGPLWTPFMTLMVLRHGGEEMALNGMWQSLRARASFRYFDWRFRSSSDGLALEGAIRAPRESFVGLRYANPPGGIKHCLNSKIAACELTITDSRSGPPRVETISTANRAAFEILTDDRDHGVEICV